MTISVIYFTGVSLILRFSFHVVTIPVIYFTDDQPFSQTGNKHSTGNKPFYETAEYPFYKTGNQPFYETGDRLFYENGDQPFTQTGDQHFPQTGNLPFYETADQPFPQTGDQPFTQTDEQPCSATEFPCSDGTCIHFIVQVCNGVIDCKLHGEDEDIQICDPSDIYHTTDVGGGITNDGDEVKPSLSTTGKITFSSNYCFVLHIFHSVCRVWLFI